MLLFRPKFGGYSQRFHDCIRVYLNVRYICARQNQYIIKPLNLETLWMRFTAAVAVVAVIIVVAGADAALKANAYHSSEMNYGYLMKIQFN